MAAYISVIFIIFTLELLYYPNSHILRLSEDILLLPY